MQRLTMPELQERLRLDYHVVTGMRSPIMQATAYRNSDDLEKRRNPILTGDKGHLATQYRIDYHIKTLIGPASFSQITSVKIDLLGNGNYPFTFPSCWVTSSPIPWSPHFREGLPICIAHDMWEQGAGKILLGELIIHIAKLLNFDETSRSENYGGFRPEAARYWRVELNSKPINPNLIYPVLPGGVTSSNVGPVVNYIPSVPSDTDYNRPLRVFLCHCLNDKAAVRELYTRLNGNGIDAWLDEEKLLAGQNWKVEIPRAVKNSDIVIVCLSNNAINKDGYIQKEIRMALELADEKPEGSIFIIPLRLEPCEIPDRLSHLHCVGLDDERGYERLMRTLEVCATRLY